MISRKDQRFGTVMGFLLGTAGILIGSGAFSGGARAVYFIVGVIASAIAFYMARRVTLKRSSGVVPAVPPSLSGEPSSSPPVWVIALMGLSSVLGVIVFQAVDIEGIGALVLGLLFFAASGMGSAQLARGNGAAD